MPATVKCPTCGRSIQWSDQSPFRPFCSERCRVIDLGAWLSEKHVIPSNGTDAAPEPSDEPSN
ncbi:MAG TPA: DNA gyrase inhibitor YacG [Steroidobacteraceae bacterium]|nr:DNA gyrase inhibitor YacG [Steroidobacteraceae bacterium]